MLDGNGKRLDEKRRTARYKEHIIAKGSIQRDCVDCDKTFRPGISFEVLLLLDESFTSVGWHAHQADISIAFLNSDIGNLLYVQWYGSENNCYKLQKILYGLKPSPNLWHDELKNTLKKFGYKQLEWCESDFKFKDDMHEGVMLVHVNDLEILSSKPSLVKYRKKGLKILFKLNLLGQLKYYLAVFSSE